MELNTVEKTEQRYKVTIRLDWTEIDGERSGHVEMGQNTCNRQEREAMQHALAQEILRWGETSLIAHGLEPIRPDVKKSG